MHVDKSLYRRLSLSMAKAVKSSAALTGSGNRATREEWSILSSQYVCTMKNMRELKMVERMNLLES